MDYEKIGKLIACMRKRKGFTQEQLAVMLNVTDRSVSNWENGKNMPDLSLVKPICEILNITLNEFFNGEEESTLKSFESIENSMKVLPRNIKKYRLHKGLTQCDLARELKMTREYIFRLESEMFQYRCSIETLYKLSIILDVSIEELFAVENK